MLDFYSKYILNMLLEIVFLFIFTDMLFIRTLRTAIING